MNMTSKSAQFAALIGIDWASQRHALCLYDCATAKRESSILEHTPEAIAQWARGLQERFKGKKIALCLEQSKGPLIYALLEYPFFVLYPVNPATAARYRQAFKTSRAKDDPSDAQVCLELLLHHREKLTPWLPDDASTRELCCLLQHRRTAIDLRTFLPTCCAMHSRAIIPRPWNWPVRISLLRWAASSCSNGLRSRSCTKRARKVCASFITRTTAGAWM